MYDRVYIEDDIEELDFDTEYQTKQLKQMPGLDVYKIENKRLFKEDAEYETVPKEERPFYGDDDFDKSPFEQLAGMTKKTRKGWEDINYHGIFEIHTSSESYKLKFTDGNLVDVLENER